MPYLGQDIKKLGFGLMRLPMKGGDVDMEQMKQMVDLFMQKGFTYFDTAYVYMDGKSEKAAKAALVDRYPRESFQLATKMAAWLGPKSAGEARQTFHTSLARTGAGYFDYYLLHNLGGQRTRVFDDFKLWDFLHEQKDRGLIKHLGFSFHDRADVLDEILTKHPEMEFVQLQINYADWDSEAVESRKCYETARRHHKPVIIMEPVKGGSLANLHDDAVSILKKVDPAASTASWAIRFAASLEGVITVLSGMSNLEQMKDNLSYMEDFRPLDAGERQAIGRVQSILAATPGIPCTECRYCTKGCPQSIDIPGIFAAMNNYMVYNNFDGGKGHYGWITRDGGFASKCIECGQCEMACPHGIAIMGELKKAASWFE